MSEEENFKYSDFKNNQGCMPSPKEVAETANRIFKEWLEKQPVYQADLFGDGIVRSARLV